MTLHDVSMRRRVRWVRAIALAVAMTSLYGCIFATMNQRKDLERAIVKAEDEMRRLEYVNKRFVELEDKEADLRSRIAEAAAAHGVDPAIPAPAVQVDPARLAKLRQSPPSMAYVPRGHAPIGELQDHLDTLNADIQAGINREKTLPDVERDVAALEARLAEIQALPATAAGAPTEPKR